MKLLLVTLYFPPAGGGGVQRPLKFASHLPALGIETHVLAPDDPKWMHEDADLPLPTQAWIHRARYVGPRGRRIADEQHGRSGMELALMRASTLGRRLLLPDENVTWNATAIPKAIALARNEGIDVVLTTSPPGSVHLIGAAVQKATGVKWVADLRDSVAMHAHRSTEGIGARAKQKARAGVAHLVARQADAIVCAAESIAVETRGLKPRGRVVTITNGCDFDDFAGLEYTRGDRFRLTHAGSFFGKRDPKPFLRALAESGIEDVTVRFLGDFRPGDREFMESLGLSDRVELIDHVPRRESLRLQRESDVLLLLIPEAGGRGRGVLSGKVFEYLAAERPVLAVVPEDGAAAELIRDTGAGIVAGPEDVPAIRDALVSLHARWRAGELEGTPLSPAWRDKLSRASRVEELADVLESLV
jgi:glycosyltransferase involved in cell wall biosynthesis